MPVKPQKYLPSGKPRWLNRLLPPARPEPGPRDVANSQATPALQRPHFAPSKNDKAAPLGFPPGVEVENDEFSSLALVHKRLCYRLMNGLFVCAILFVRALEMKAAKICGIKPKAATGMGLHRLALSLFTKMLNDDERTKDQRALFEALAQTVRELCCLPSPLTPTSGDMVKFTATDKEALKRLGYRTCDKLYAVLNAVELIIPRQAYLDKGCNPQAQPRYQEWISQAGSYWHSHIREEVSQGHGSWCRIAGFIETHREVAGRNSNESARTEVEKRYNALVGEK
ncbi:hypothetical protein T439DRAFT_352379 [Meredithblackwellia eburnea MCA 4105]